MPNYFNIINYNKFLLKNKLGECLLDSQLDKKIVLIVTTLGAFITPFMASAVNVALPSISKEFMVSSVILNWIALSFSLATALFILPFGRLADIVGRKRLLIWGMSVFSLASALCGISFNSAMLIIARALQGVSAATISVTVVSILTSVYSPGERGKVLGLNVTATYTGLSMGPFLGGFLTKYMGWRSLFLIVVPIGAIIVILLFKLKGEWAEAKGEKFDYMGSVIYAAALFGIIGGLSFIHSSLGLVLIVIGAISIIIFGILESKIKEPILDMTLMKGSKVLTMSSLAALINYSATFAISYLLSLYLQYIKGFDSAQAGIILIAQPVVMALFSPIAGKLSDKIEPQKVASIGMALTTVGLGLFTLLSNDTSIIYIISGLLVLGFGFALFSSPNTNAVMSSVEKKYYGVASGILGAARNVGQSLSMGIASFTLTFYMGDAQFATGNNSNFITAVKVTFAILTLLCFMGIFASIARGKINRK